MTRGKTRGTTRQAGRIEEALAPLWATTPEPSTGRIRSLTEARSALGIPTSAEPDVLQTWGKPADFQLVAFLVSDEEHPERLAEFAALRLISRQGRRLVAAQRGDRLRLDEAASMLWLVCGAIVQAADGILVIESLAIGPAFPRPSTRQSGDPAQGISGQLLRQLSPGRLLSETVEYLLRQGYWRDALAPEGATPIPDKQHRTLERLEQGRPRRTHVSDDHLAEIATHYLVLCSRGVRRPLPVIAREFGITREQARDRIHKARARRYLSPGTQGRAGATMGPALAARKTGQAQVKS